VPPLDLSPEEFRAAAAQVADAAERFLAGLDDRRVAPDTTGADVAAAFGGPVPEQGLGPAALDDLPKVAELGRVANARFFGYVHGSGEPVAAIADLYASVINQNATAWRSAPAGVAIERTVVGWLADAIGCAGFSGAFTSGGSLANLMALAMARESRLPANENGARPAVVYVSSEAHMSMHKALALLGLGRANLRVIDVDDDLRMRVDVLEQAIAQDRAAGRPAIAIVATAGTVNTGAIDPLAAIARVARDNDLWLHVDGAYGAPAAIAVPERFAGLELADSISLDAHKWLYQPLDCSVLLYRDPAIARTTFAYTGDYARALTDDPVEGFAFFEETIELSRRFRALKLWASLRYHGLARFREAIRANLEQAQLLARLVEAEPGLELLAPAELSAVCFRVSDAGDAASLNARNEEILRRVTREGRVYLSNASIRGAFALRACFVNHRTTDADVEAIIAAVSAAATARTQPPA
jgi:aromatic-L-amino-acid/L-tryptophan decarboxylase